MSQSFSMRRAVVSTPIILSLVAMTALSGAWLGFQGPTKPVTPKPATQKPAVPKTAIEKPPVAKSGVEKPAAQKPATGKPVPEKTAPEKTAPEKSTPEKSVVQKPATPAKPGERVLAGSSVEKLLPAKPVFLYIWDGSEAHQKTWDATAFKNAFVGSGLYSSVEKLLKFALENAGGGQEAVIGELVARAITKGASISVVVENVSDQSAVQVVFVLRDSAESAKILDKVQAEVSELKVETISDRKVTRIALPFADGYEVGWWTDGGHLVIAGGLKAIEAALDVATGKSANLTTNAIVQKLRKSDDFDVASVSVVDFKALLDLVRTWDVPPLPGSDKPPVKVDELLKIAGVDKLGVMTERWGFCGEAIWIESDLEAPAPLTGLMALYDQKPLTLNELPALPASCEYFMLARHDLSKTYASLISMAELVAGKIAPGDAPPVSEALNGVNEALGIDLKADLMEPLGDTMALYVEGVGLLPGGVILWKLDDAKKVLDSLVKIENRAKELSAGVPGLEFREKVTLGRTIHILRNLGQSFVSLNWVVDKDWLVIGTTPQSVEAYLKRVDGKLAKWQPTAEIAATQKMLPDKFATYYYFDPRGVLKFGLGLAPTGIAMLEEMSTARIRRDQDDLGQKQNLPQFPITPEDIPVADEINGPLFPSIGTCTVDATGIHWRNRNSIPGLLIPGIPGGTGGIDSMYTLLSNASMFFVSARAVNLQPPAAVRDAN